MVQPGDRIKFNIPTEEADWEGCPDGPGQHRLFWGRNNPIPGHEKILAARYRQDQTSHGVVVEVIPGYINLHGKKIADFVAIYGYEGQYAPATALSVVDQDLQFSKPHTTGQSIYELRKKREYCKWGCFEKICQRDGNA